MRRVGAPSGCSSGVLFELETEGGQEILQGEGDQDVGLVGVLIHSESEHSRFGVLLFRGDSSM